MKAFSVKMDDFHYCITSPSGEDGAIVPYGDRAFLDDGTNVYTCLVIDADAQEVEVYRVDELTQVPAEVDEVIFPEDVTKALKDLDAAIERHEGEGGEDAPTLDVEKVN